MKKKQNRKATPPASTLEPYDMDEWEYLIQQVAQGDIKKPPEIVWLPVGKNGTLWPHKVVRE